MAIPNCSLMRQKRSFVITKILTYSILNILEDGYLAKRSFASDSNKIMAGSISLTVDDANDICTHTHHICVASGMLLSQFLGDCVR